MEPAKFAASYALDWGIGDPEWIPHPVRLMGWSIVASERIVRRRGTGKCFELVGGGVIAIAVPAVSAFCAWALLSQARRLHRVLGIAAEVWLASTCIATRNLLDETAEVMRAQNAGDLARARRRLARIVGRDTHQLDERGVSRAVVETLAESLSDGIVAPLFYLVLGGVPLAMAYKAVNTLDSMLGHRDQQYLYFGRVAAHMDDAANYMPARISAFLLCLAAGWIPGASGLRACRVWLRDGTKHASPNAGQVEAAMAGALGVRLGGTNHYGNQKTVSPHLGAEFPLPNRSAASRGWKITALASFLAFGGALLFALRKHDA
jgi:adenosylcobinamide-phosphate synthase